MLSATFIRRPKTAIVISLVLTLMGLIAYRVLPVEQFPDITPPVVRVTATFPGASAEVVENTVAAPIEAQVNGVDDMLFMSSSSSDSGRYSLAITFAVGTDPDLAAVNVQNRVAQAMASLPAEVTARGVVTRKAASNILMVPVLYSPNGTYDEVFLSNYASINLRDALARVPGVGDAEVLTDLEYAMRIWMDPDRMAGLGLTPTDVIGAIRQQNLEVSAGQIGAPPAPEGQQFQYTVRAKGRLATPEEFGNIVIRTGDAGSIVRVRDIARVELGATFYNASGRFAGRPATVMAVYQAPGESALAVAERVKAELERMARLFPDDIAYAVPFDSTDFIQQSFDDVVTTLLLTFALVMSVVFVFLGSWRASVIPMVAIPVSLIGAMAFMLAFGMTLNTVSLFALVLAIGIVVDDAIVVVENVERLMAQEGLSPPAATLKAMGQITGPVIATTLVLLAVFVPVTFMPGISGRLYAQFALTISIAVVISSINALTLSPALCALMLRPRKGPPRGLLAVFERAIAAAGGGYVAVVRRFVRVAILSLVVLAGIGFATGSLMKGLPQGFLPQEDNGGFFVDIQLPDAAALNRTEAVTERIARAMEAIPGVQDTVLVNGFSLMNGGGANGAMLIVNLDPWSERTTPETSLDSILAQAMAIGNNEVGASVIAFNPPPIPGLGLTAGVEMEVQQTGSGSAQDLQAALGGLVFAANQRPEIARAFTTFRANVPQLFVDLDRDKARSLGVSVSDVFVTLQSYLGGFYVNDFTQFGRVFRVMIQAEGDFRAQADDIARLHVRSSSGRMVPLGTLLTVEPILGPTGINRYNLFRAASVTAIPAPGYSTGDAITALSEAATQSLPPRYAYEWTGTAQQQLESAGVVQVILVLAILFGYLFLVAQYESWTMPTAILLSVIVALFGAVAAVGLTGGDVNLYTQIGMIMLIGLGAKNAILIVEFAMERRAAGLSIREAAVEAAQQRFRAVMMTALSFLLGVVPLMVATGAGAASQRAIGIAVFGGMLAATILGVVLVPVLYVVLQALRERIKGRPAEVPPAAIEAGTD